MPRASPPEGGNSNEHALTQNASSFENFSDEKSQKSLSTFENFSAKTSSDFENFSDESSSDVVQWSDENPTDVENFCDDRLDAWLAMEEESFHAPPLIHLGAMDAALQKIAGLLGLPLSRCVLFSLDAGGITLNLAPSSHGKSTLNHGFLQEHGSNFRHFWSKMKLPKRWNSGPPNSGAIRSWISACYLFAL
ncbi:MAG: hypothetical protein R3E66_03115 [bacterium]